MRIALRNILLFVVIYEATFQFAAFLFDTWLGWLTSNDPLRFASFYIECSAQFGFVALAYVGGGLAAQRLFSGACPVMWSGALCLVLLVFSPVPWGHALIADVGSLTELAFLVSVHLPPLMFGVSASLAILWRLHQDALSNGHPTDA